MTNRLYNEYHTWSKNEKDFKVLKEISDKDNIPLVYFDVLDKKFIIEDSNIFIDTSLTGENSTLFYSNYEYISIKDNDSQIEEKFEDLKNDINKCINDSFMNIEIDKKGIGLIDKKIIENKLDRELIMDKCISIKNPNTSFIIRKNPNIVNYFKIDDRKYFSYYDDEKDEIITNQIKEGITEETNMLKLNQLKVVYLKKKRNICKKPSIKKSKKKRSNSVK